MLLLHGRGADENDLLGLSEYLDERLLILSVRAPFSFQFGGGYTWYEILEVGRPEPGMFATSCMKLNQLLRDALTGYPIDPTRVMLCGFSMGTVMAYSLTLTNPEMIHSVVANSGYIPEGTELTLQWHMIKGKPFFVSHGTYDPVIPVSFGRRAKELLANADARLTYREYDMGHQISEESLGDIMSWTSKLLGSDPPH